MRELIHICVINRKYHLAENLSPEDLSGRYCRAFSMYVYSHEARKLRSMTDRELSGELREVHKRYTEKIRTIQEDLDLLEDAESRARNR